MENFASSPQHCPSCGHYALVHGYDIWRCDATGVGTAPTGCGQEFPGRMAGEDAVLGFLISMQQKAWSTGYAFWQEPAIHLARKDRVELRKAWTKDVDMIMANPGKAIRTNTSITYALVIERRLRGTQPFSSGYPIGWYGQPRSASSRSTHLQYVEVVDLVVSKLHFGLMGCLYVKSKRPTLIPIGEGALLPEDGDLRERLENVLAGRTR